jgi:hypothetical protein
VLDGIFRARERDQMDADAAALELEELVQDERLREAGEAVDDDDEVRAFARHSNISHRRATRQT